MTARSGGSKTVVYAALAGNLAIAVTKFIAAYLTGSSAMLSEGIHSMVDTSNEVLLLYGMRRAARPPDLSHPLGHGRELYFWSFIVALLVFALGAGVSIYEGVQHILRPEPTGNHATAFVVLGLSFLFEGVSWRVAVKEFGRTKGELGWIAAMRRSKDPTTFTVLVEDTAALLGLVIAFAGIAAGEFLEMPVLDGVASVGIGLVLAVTAAFLARESKGLLIGEEADPALQSDILAVAAADPAVAAANGVLTVQLGPRQVVAALSAEFDDRLSTSQIEAAVARLERAIRARRPEVSALFVKPQTGQTWRERRERLGQPVEG